VIRFRCACGCQQTFLIGDLAGRAIRCPSSGRRWRFSPETLARRRLPAERLRKWSRPNEILPYLAARAGDRKRRLLHCSFCRLRWRELAPFHRRAVETAERYADGLAGDEELAVAAALAGEDPRALAESEGAIGSWVSRFYGLWTEGPPRSPAPPWVLAALRNDELSFPEPATPAERKARCDAIRELFGCLFWAPALDPTWLAWGDGTVPKLARAISDERRWADLPILGDALEEAGCSDAVFLDHCRQPAEHRPGCWLLDLLAGRKT
jgi:hypothetical protein